MDLIESSIRIYEQSMYDKMRIIKHVHPPITETDNTCLYCKVHGNVFTRGVIDADYTRLCNHVLPVSKTCQN